MLGLAQLFSAAEVNAGAAVILWADYALRLLRIFAKCIGPCLWQKRRVGMGPPPQ